ncbi:RAMP superfamily CRISPR-associated protein [Methylomagnum ishizawai]|uniref:RAMP superfamily CRISPR-associated protein n=1 Tax=Methylomagnum ishizawai TaxID=1760988 RepID=UPI001C32320F|nr:RAMP superfamily CRISPR-associated protein [Methylomagnum ishizawai]BBL74616.1 hypothetical protein MishRS11D_17140 [Methylomagnum ishizawai]
MPEATILEIEMLDYWHCGSGNGSGDYLDRLAERDSLGLPFVPGRLLKGLLREACLRCEALDHVPTGTTLALFGAPNGAEAHSLPGGLRVADARLPQALRDWLGAPASTPYRQALSRELFTAAVDESTGTTRERRPRGMEAIVPVTLHAALEPLAGADLPTGWRASLALALPLAGAVGAYRTRGLGRCAMRILDGGTHGAV